MIALQKRLLESLDRYRADEANFSKDVDQIKEDSDKNEQAFEANAMGVVGSCMNGERNITTGASKSLLCWKPKMVAGPNGPDGKPTLVQASGSNSMVKQPCGPLEFIRAQVEQSAYLTGNNGQPMMNAENQDSAAAKSARFDAVMQSILRDFGALPGQDDTRNGLVTRVTNAAGFSAKYDNNLRKMESDLQVRPCIDGEKRNLTLFS